MRRGIRRRASDGRGGFGRGRLGAFARVELLAAEEEVGGYGFGAGGCGGGGGGDGGVIDCLGHGALVVEHAACWDAAAQRAAVVVGGACAADALGFLVAYWGGEVDFQVGFEDADGAVEGDVGFCFEDGHFVDGVVVGEGEDVIAG